MRALVIGCGYMGRIHSANLRRLGVEVLQYDLVKEKCDSYTNEVYGQDFDLVIIATPIKTHYQVFSELYSYYGRRVAYLIEKPVVETLEKFRRILETDCDIFVGHQLRYSRFYAMIKEEVEESLAFNVEMEVCSPSDPDVGLLLDTGIHFLDLPVYFIGSPSDFEVKGGRNSFELVLYYDKGVWRIRGQLKDSYRIEFLVNNKRGMSDGRLMELDGKTFQDVDSYYEEVREVVDYLLNNSRKPRISLQNLIATYELAFKIIEVLV